MSDIGEREGVTEGGGAGAGIGPVVVTVNAVLAGVGGLYAATRSTVVVIVAAALAVV